MARKPGPFPQLLLDVHDELIVDLFAGGGGASLGIEMATGRQVDVAVNHDPVALALHEANHPQTKHIPSDVFEVDPREVTQGRPVGLLWASPDCFPGGTLILTDQGYRPIEEIQVGDRVLSHRGFYQRVTDVMSTGRALVRVTGQGHPGLLLSGEHPIYIRQPENTWDTERRCYQRRLLPPMWWTASEIPTDIRPMNKAGAGGAFWATPCVFPALPIPQVGGRSIDIDSDLMWLAGRYVGDGWTRTTETRAELVITCGKHEAAAVRRLLDRWPREGERSGRNELAWHDRETKTAHQFATNHRGLVEWLRSEFGHGAEAKSFPAWAFGMPEEWRASLLDGYVSADGHTRTISGTSVTAAQTVSKALAFSLRALAESLGYTAHVVGPYENRNEIEGRRVHALPVWNVKWRHGAQRAQNVRDGLHNWTRVQAVEPTDLEETVYNLSVEHDESYVAEGIVVHNCTDHSKAKGGKPFRDSARKRRALAWVVTRWAGQVRPRVIMLENVEEFAQWGPLVGTSGDLRRCPKRKGRTFRAWVRSLEELGYVVEWRELRACDYGAPTIRKRLFVVARCDGKPIVWPTPTHGPTTRRQYRTAAECIDWSVPMLSIFATREEARAWGREHGRAAPIRPLAEATMRRIARGVMKFVVDAAEPFVVTLNHGGTHRPHGLDEPLRTVTSSRDAHALVAPVVAGFRGESAGRSIDEPLGTVTANSFVKRPGGSAPIGLVAPFLKPRYGERAGQDPRVRDLQEPYPAVVGTGNGGDLVGAFLAKHYGGNESPGAPLDRPASTLTTQDHHHLVAAHIQRDFGTSTGHDARDPLHTITSDFGGHAAMVASFLSRYHGQGVGSALDAPASTLTAKDRLGLVTVMVAGEPYVIVDIAMRMLQPRELFRAQGFPDSYVIDRAVDGRRFTKTDQVRLVGNSVCPDVASAIVSANCPELVARDEVAA